MLTATIKNVKVFENENGASVQLTFDKEFEGFTIEEGIAKKTNVNTLSINRSALTAQLCNICDDIAMYRATIMSSFNQRQLALILFNAVVTIERDLVAAGEERNEHVFDKDCYMTTIKDIKLNAKASRKLDDACVL